MLNDIKSLVIKINQPWKHIAFYGDAYLEMNWVKSGTNVLFIIPYELTEGEIIIDGKRHKVILPEKRIVEITI